VRGRLKEVPTGGAHLEVREGGGGGLGREKGIWAGERGSLGRGREKKKGEGERRDGLGRNKREGKKERVFHF